jgi:hypothetical protein
MITCQNQSFTADIHIHTHTQSLRFETSLTLWNEKRENLVLTGQGKDGGRETVALVVIFWREEIKITFF